MKKVDKTKELCRTVFDKLKEIYGDKLLSTDEKKLIKNYADSVKVIYKQVDSENAEEKYNEIRKIRDEVENDFVVSIVDPAKERRQKNAFRATAGVLATVTAVGTVGTAYHTAQIQKYLINGNDGTETVEYTEDAPVKTIAAAAAFAPANVTVKPETTATPDATVTPEVNATPEVVTEETVVEGQQLVLGEYGTFFDINDEEQVNARAQYIFDNYFANNNTLTEQQRELITVTNIANMIRVMNDENALDENGEKVHVAGLTLNEYTKVLVETVVNTCSNETGVFSYFPAYLLFLDDSKESEYVKSYQAPYEKLVYSLNEHDDEQVEDAIACLGFKFGKEWFLQGMYGDTNPHLFRTDLKYLLFISTIEPYNATAREWHLSELKPVCIELCVNPVTGEMGTVSVNDLVEALETGCWNHIGAKLGGLDVEPNPWLTEYYHALDDSLSWKYDHRSTLSMGK